MTPYQRGDVTLYHCDFRNSTELHRASAVITDPPYGIALENHCESQCWDGTRRQSRTPASWSIANDDSQDCAMLLAGECGKHKIPLAMFGSPYLPYPGEWRNILVWDKGPAVGGGGDPAKCLKRTFELIFIANNGDLRLSRGESVLRFHVVPTDFALHPAQKPVDLMEYLVLQMTDPGDFVFDPFSGSGSTAVACINTGRRFTGYEIDAKRFDVACQRIDRELDRPRLFLPEKLSQLETQKDLFADPLHYSV
jgi:predicted RNA methylase